MPDYEIEWPHGIAADAVADSVDAWIVLRSMTCSMRTSLAKHPGCTHWHVKSGSSSGTLEITLWPAQGRLWVSMRANRMADWMSSVPADLTSELRRYEAAQAPRGG